MVDPLLDHLVARPRWSSGRRFVDALSTSRSSEPLAPCNGGVEFGNNPILLSRDGVDVDSHADARVSDALLHARLSCLQTVDGPLALWRHQVVLAGVQHLISDEGDHQTAKHFPH